MNTSFDGIELIGWSTQLYKLGDTEIEYYSIGQQITVNDDIIKNGEIILYPVYRVESRSIDVDTYNGGATIETLASFNTNGYVNVSGISNEPIVLAANAYISIEINRFTNIT